MGPLLSGFGSSAIWGDDKVQRVFFAHVAQMDLGQGSLGMSQSVTCEGNLWNGTATWVPRPPLLMVGIGTQQNLTSWLPKSS